MDSPPDAAQLSGFRKTHSWLQALKILRCSYISARRDIFGNFSHSRRGGYWVSVAASSGLSPTTTLRGGREETRLRVLRFPHKHVEGKQRTAAAARRCFFWMIKSPWTLAQQWRLDLVSVRTWKGPKRPPVPSPQRRLLRGRRGIWSGLDNWGIQCATSLSQDMRKSAELHQKWFELYYSIVSSCFLFLSLF